MLAIASSAVAQDSAVINFTSDLDTLTATNFPDPLASGPLALFAAAVPDINKLDGQIWIQNYTGAGTYTAAFNNNTGNKILLHSPLLERIEAQTWRAEDASDFGVTEISGTAVSQRSKFLLPDDTPNGVFTVEINGSNEITSLNYTYDFSTNPGLGFSDEAGNPALANLQLDEVTITGDSSNFGTTEIFAAGSSDFLDTAYGLNTQLDTTTNVGGSFGAFSPGVANGTVGDTTIGMLLNEINANTDEMGGSTGNISEDGRLDGAMAASITNPEQGDGYLADIFAATSGDLYVFTSSSDLATDVTVSQIPEPGTLVLAAAAGLTGLLRRRRQC